MDAADIEGTLKRCEDALERPGKIDLKALGFWKVVTAVKKDGALARRYGRRIAHIDREAFVRKARPLVFPAALGVILEAAGTVVGVALVIVAPSLQQVLDPRGVPEALIRLPFPYWTEFAYIVGAGVLIGATHALTHWVVGSAMGVRFTHFYSLPPLKPQPGFKIDYETYLRVPARSRAWMHASGALVSKAIPFVVAAVAVAGGAQAWAIAVLLAIGVVQLITDVTLSTRASDWKKFKREMRFAR